MGELKRIISMIFLIIGFGSLVACSNNETVTEKQVKHEKDNEGSTDEPFEFTIMANLHTSEVPDGKIEELIEEKTNVQLDITWVPDTSYEEKLNTAFATGTLPDAVYMKNQTTFIRFKEAIRDGQFWEIGPYLEEFENLKNLKKQVLENTMVDGKLYTLYQGRPLSRQGFIYRKDWADNLGLSTPKTTEEFFNMAKAFTENDPDGNGKNDTIGLTDRSDLVYGAFKTVASWFGTPNNWGEIDGKLLPEFMFPAYLDTLDYFRELHSNGYINHDFPVTSSNDQIAMMKNGTAGLYVGNIGFVSTLYNDAVKLNPEVEYDVQNQVTGPDGTFGVWSIPGYGNVVMFPKSSVETEGELKKILAFYDKLMTPEVANILFYGVEGEHYTFEDGLAVSSKDVEKTNREVKPYHSLEIGEKETNGRYTSTFSSEVKEKAEYLIIDNENYLINDPTITLDSSTYIEKGGRLQQIIEDATYQYILGDTDKNGFQEAVDEWKKQGGDQIIEEFNQSYKKVK